MAQGSARRHHAAAGALMLYMLDTNIASAAIRGHAAIDQRLADMQPGDWCISAVTHAELRYGAALHPGSERLARAVGGFLAVARTISWGAEAADAHGMLRAELRKQGRPIGAFDEMIAAHALSLGAAVVTDNVRHFGGVPGLAVENWLRGG